MAGHRCGKEDSSAMGDSEKYKLDAVAYYLTENALLDVRTVAGGDSIKSSQELLPKYRAIKPVRRADREWAAGLLQ